MTTPPGHSPKEYAPPVISSFWKAVLDSSHNGVVVIDRQGTILVYNQAARRIFGDRGESPVGRHFSRVRPDAWSDLESVLTSGRPQIGKRIVTRHATIIANRTPVILAGQVAGAVSVFQDISEYENIISELEGFRELSREMEAIFESSDDGLYITDGNAVTRKVNSSYERITGLKREQLIGRSMPELVQERIFDHSVTLEVLKQGSQVSLMQSIRGGKHVMVTGTPIKDETGAIDLVVTNVRDMTLLNELQTQLEQTRRLSTRYRQSLKEQDQFEHVLKDMVIKSAAMAQVIKRAVKVAQVDTSVLISGESGVGKSMLAGIIHLMGPRKEGPLVKINCGAIPESLMESELFGYAKGAFTGAAPEGKAGLLEAAHNGTVFFDEVGELTLAMQVKLLQVIEDKRFTRVGEVRPTEVDVRIIAATNKDLKAEAAAGRFRQDLYYRLNVIPVAIPPLRERPEDIAALALKFLERHNKKAGTAKRLEPAVLDALAAYAYPGNVRELLNILERMLVIGEGAVVGLEDLPGELRAGRAERAEALPEGGSLKEALALAEARLIALALRRHGGPTAAARALGMHPTTLWRKMARLGLAHPAK